MDAGEFDRRITLQRKLEIDDGVATVADNWSNLATVWAKFIPLPSVERLAASETAAFSRVRYKIRRGSSWSDLNAADRFLDENGRACDICVVASEGRGFYLIDAVCRGDA